MVVHALLCIDTARTEDTHTDLGEALSSGDKTVRHRAAQGYLGIFRPLVLWRFTSLSKHLVMKTNSYGSPSSILSINSDSGGSSYISPGRILAGSDDIIERGIVSSVLGSIGPAAEEAITQLLKCLQEPGDSAARVYFRLRVADALWRSREPQSTFWHGTRGGEEPGAVAAVAGSGIIGRAWKLLEVMAFLNFAGWRMTTISSCEGRQASR